MQQNIAELTQKLLGALDDDYNVTNMATIIEVITLLEKVTITKEMLETTRLGKHINELRKHIANEVLAKRAKLLVKKWRNIVLVEVPAPPPPPSPVAYNHVALGGGGGGAMTNGQLRGYPMVSPQQTNYDDASSATANKKRVIGGVISGGYAKKPRANGGPACAASTPHFDYDFSDNSNSSFKDVSIVPNQAAAKLPTAATGIVAPPLPPPPLTSAPHSAANSDSNSSMPEQQRACSTELSAGVGAAFDEQMMQPKKRGRKKGSKNHKNLLEEAESSFSNKMAVSRGNAKVKTTAELIESLQSRASIATPTPPLTSPAKAAPSAEDWRERAAKLTERVSLIDQKLNSGGARGAKKHAARNNSATLLTTPPRVDTDSEEDEEKEEEEDDDDVVVVVDDDMLMAPSSKRVRKRDRTASPDGVELVDAPDIPAGYVVPCGALSLSVEECLRRLPPVDKPALHASDSDDDCMCCCVLEEEEEEEEEVVGARFRVYADCQARKRLEEKYRLTDPSDERVDQLHRTYVDQLNGNLGVVERDAGNERVCVEESWSPGASTAAAAAAGGSSASSVNIVPNFYRLPPKTAPCSENYKKYSISEVDASPHNSPTPTIHHPPPVILDPEPEPAPHQNHQLEYETNELPIAPRVEEDGAEAVGKDEVVFREFHECVDRPSYNGEMLRILPYVIID